LVLVSDKLKDWKTHKPRNIVDDDDSLWLYLTYRGDINKKYQPEFYKEAEIYVRRQQDGEPLMGLCLYTADAGTITSVKLRLNERIWSFRTMEDLQHGDKVVLVW
jgi:hypothetical protein